MTGYFMPPEQVHICLETAEKEIGKRFTPGFYRLCEDLGRMGVFDAFWDALEDSIGEEPDQTKWITAALERLRKGLVQ